MLTAHTPTPTQNKIPVIENVQKKKQKKKRKRNPKPLVPGKWQRK